MSLIRGILLMVVLCLGWALAIEAAAQPDSVRAEILREKGLPTDHTPRKALWRAIALPGWGQYYNHQYYKIPIAYAGLAGFVAAIVYTNDRYGLYYHAALYRQDEEEYARFESAYVQALRKAGADPMRGSLSADDLRDVRDKYRRWRDLSVVGTGLFYALQVLDAYVSAHLLTFDVGEELEASVQPFAAASSESSVQLARPGVRLLVRL